jgi:hypothetical protein
MREDGGIYGTVTPEPATFLLFTLGGIALRGFGKLTAGRKR